MHVQSLQLNVLVDLRTMLDGSGLFIGRALMFMHYTSDIGRQYWLGEIKLIPQFRQLAAKNKGHTWHLFIRFRCLWAQSLTVSFPGNVHQLGLLTWTFLTCHTAAKSLKTVSDQDMGVWGGNWLPSDLLPVYGGYYT